MRVEELTAPERMLWEAFPSGEAIDLTGGRTVDDSLRGTRPDPAGGDHGDHGDDGGLGGGTGMDRRIRGHVLVALLLGARETLPGQIAAVRLSGAHITGPVNLAHADVGVPLALTSCTFDEPLQLTWARTQSLHLMYCRLPGLIASGVRVDGPMWLEGSRVSGQTLLDGAHVSGILNLGGVTLANPGGEALLGDRLTVDANAYFDDGFRSEGELRLPGARIGGQLIFRKATLSNPGKAALYASRLQVSANVFCDNGFKADGEVRLRGARVGGYLSLIGASLRRPGGTALNADDLAVDTDVYCSGGFSANGIVSFSGARVGGQLSLQGGRLRNDSGPALRMQRTQVEELVLRPSEPIGALVDLSYARIGLLRDDPQTWPAGLQLDGLTYDVLDPPLGARERLGWLRRDTDGYQPQPYERLAQTYRELGLDADARTVQLARQRDRRAGQGLARRLWGLVQDVTVGYGYRPFRALMWLSALLATGTVVFQWHRPPVLDDGQRPSFNSFLYTLDLLLPVGTLGQETAFAPRGVYQWIASALIVAGFVLGLTVAAGATRVLSRE